MGLLDGRRAIVTGAGSGIGAAVARRFAAEGATVGVLDRHADAARSIAEEVGGVALEADVADAASLDRAVADGVDALGGLTDLVNNAGVGMLKRLHEYTDEDWALLLGVNLTGVFHGIRAAVPHLLRSERASVVNVASLNVHRPTPGEGPYTAAKAGVVSLTSTAAVEYAPRIRVNCVSPGMVETPLTAMITGEPALRAAVEAGTPLGRIASADDVAAVVAFLASDGAAHLTGQNVVIDGGSSLLNPQSDALVRPWLSPPG